MKLIRLIKPYCASLYQLFILLSAYLPSQALRKALMSLLGARIGRNVRLYYGCEIRGPRNLTIGDGTIIGWKSVLDARGGLHIGSNVNLSSEVAIWTAQHDPQSVTFEVLKAPVYIHDNVWLSFRSVILPGVTIGEGSVVAACAVVTKNVPAYSIVAGVPAKIIGKRTAKITYQLKELNYLRFL